MSFLSEVLYYFQGITGTVAIEKDVLDLISSNYTYPNEIYRYDMIDIVNLIKQVEQDTNYIAAGYRSEERIIMNCL